MLVRVPRPSVTENSCACCATFARITMRPRAMKSSKPSSRICSCRVQGLSPAGYACIKQILELGFDDFIDRGRMVNRAKVAQHAHEFSVTDGLGTRTSMHDCWVLYDDLGEVLRDRGPAD